MIKRVLAINFSEKWNGSVTSGYFQVTHHWNNNNYFIDKSSYTDFLKLLKKIETNKPVIKPKDVIYTSQSSDIPRFKLKEFISENKLKRTTRYNKANKIIINRGILNSIKSRIEKGDYTFVNDNFLKQHWNEIFKNLSPEYVNECKEIYNNTKDKDLVGYIFNYNGNNYTQTLLKKYPAQKLDLDQNSHKVEGVILNLYRDRKSGNTINILMDLHKEIMSGKVEIMFDEDLFVDLNKDGIVLDEEYLQTLRDMLFSTDKDNIKLGFEMMSNLVIDQPTMLSLAFLLNELYHQKGFRPSYYTQQNSNLKSLLKLFSVKQIHWDRDWKTFGSGLRVNFKDGKEGEIVKKFLLDNINREFKLKNSQSEALVDIVFATEA